MNLEGGNVSNIPENKEEKERSIISGVGNIKNIVADKLHSLAQTISRKTASPGAKPEVAHYGNEASTMLEQSADYLRDLDFTAAEASVREYIKKNPGRSLVIAGVTGLIIGAIFRRR